MNDLADEFATWIVLNALEDIGDYRWVRYKDRVRFEWNAATKAWIRERRLLGLPYISAIELKRALRRKPYSLPRTRAEGPVDCRVAMRGIKVTELLDVPDFLGHKRLYHPRRDEWKSF